MDIFLNYGMAWMSVLFMLTLSVKYIVRKQLMKDVKNEFWKKWNHRLRKSHIYFGILLIFTGFIHGMNSSFDVLSWNFGTITFLLSILLGLNYYFRKKVRPWIKYHRILTLVIIISLVIHIVEVGGIQIFNILSSQAIKDIAPNNKNDIQDSKTNNQGESSNSFGTNVVLKDGTYEGSARGYRDYITVSITISNNRVTDIEVTDINDDYKYYATPVRLIPNDIMNSQSLEVDTISRATFSSIGIINAVNDALQQALESGTLTEKMSLPSFRR